MENLKIITTDEFIEKYDNNTLEDEDLVENGEYYIIFKIVINNFLERYFIKTYYETGPVFEIK